MTDLLTRKDIADLCAMQQRYVPTLLESRPDFPRPVLNLSQKMVRWARTDVVQWLEKHRKMVQR